jgi:hypothetical protein
MQRRALQLTPFSLGGAVYRILCFRPLRPTRRRGRSDRRIHAWPIPRSFSNSASFHTQVSRADDFSLITTTNKCHIEFGDSSTYGDEDEGWRITRPVNAMRQNLPECDRRAWDLHGSDIKRRDGNVPIFGQA